MGQEDVCELLEKNPGVWMSVKEINDQIPSIGLQSVNHNLQSLIKREDYEAQLVSSPGRYGSKTVYRYQPKNK